MIDTTDGLLIAYLALLDASVGTLLAAVMSDRKDKIPNAAVAAISGIALLFALAAMVLRTASGAPTATLGSALPWFFLALCSSYTFLVWMGQPGSRSTLGVAAGLTGLLSILLEGTSRLTGPAGPFLYPTLLLPPISFGTFLGSGVALHWYVKLPGVDPVMARALLFVGLCAALLSFSLQSLLIASNAASSWPSALTLTTRVAFGSALPLIAGGVALRTLALEKWASARSLLYLAAASSGLGLCIAKGMLLLTGLAL